MQVFLYSICWMICQDCVGTLLNDRDTVTAKWGGVKVLGHLRLWQMWHARSVTSALHTPGAYTRQWSNRRSAHQLCQRGPNSKRKWIYRHASSSCLLHRRAYVLISRHAISLITWRKLDAVCIFTAGRTHCFCGHGQTDGLPGGPPLLSYGESHRCKTSATYQTVCCCPRTEARPEPHGCAADGRSV